MFLLAAVARGMARIGRWLVAADCTCGASTAPDCEHHPRCPHPLRASRVHR